MKRKDANYIAQWWRSMDSTWRDSSYHKTAQAAIREILPGVPHLVYDRRVVEAGTLVQVAHFSGESKIIQDRREALGTYAHLKEPADQPREGEDPGPDLPFPERL